MKIKVFTSPTCGPCKMYKGMLGIFADEIEYIDVTVRPEVATKYQIRSVPTTVFPDGKQVVGTISKGEFLNLMEKHA